MMKTYASQRLRLRVHSKVRAMRSCGVVWSAVIVEEGAQRYTERTAPESYTKLEINGMQ